MLWFYDFGLWQNLFEIYKTDFLMMVLNYAISSKIKKKKKELITQGELSQVSIDMTNAFFAYSQGFMLHFSVLNKQCT